MHPFYSFRWPRFLQVSRMAFAVSMMLAIFQLPGHQVLAQVRCTAVFPRTHPGIQ
jgi:hypothetical protein